MNISRYANIDKFVNIRYIFLLARRAYSCLFQLAQMWKLLAPGVGLGDLLTPAYVIFFQNYGLRTPSNMATVVTMNRKLVKKFIKKLFQNPVKSQMQLNHMERMHMWSFKILIEDLRLSSNVAVTVTKYRKLLSKNKKSGKKPVATKLYGNDAHMIHFQTYGC